MDELAKLSDDELFQRAQQLHVLAKQGDGKAKVDADRYVEEARRRFSYATTLAAPLEVVVSKRPWWQFW